MLTPVVAEGGGAETLRCFWRHKSGMSIEFGRKEEFETFVHNAKRRGSAFQYGSADAVVTESE